jgi:hypothetical protein
LGREDDDRIITEQSEGYTDQDINEHYQVVAQRRIDQAAWVDDEEELENCFSSVGRLNQVVPSEAEKQVGIEDVLRRVLERFGGMDKDRELAMRVQQDDLKTRKEQEEEATRKFLEEDPDYQNAAAYGD